MYTLHTHKKNPSLRLRHRLNMSYLCRNPCVHLGNTVGLNTIEMGKCACLQFLCFFLLGVHYLYCKSNISHFSECIGKCKTSTNKLENIKIRLFIQKGAVTFSLPPWSLSCCRVCRGLSPVSPSLPVQQDSPLLSFGRVVEWRLDSKSERTG